jgi:hypothetical protein
MKIFSLLIFKRSLNIILFFSSEHEKIIILNEFLNIIKCELKYILNLNNFFNYLFCQISKFL